MKCWSTNCEVIKCFYSRLPSIFLAFVVSALIYFYYEKNYFIVSSEDFVDTTSKFFVRVSGESVRPGIYAVTANCMTDSVIKMAISSDGALKYEKTDVYDKYIENGSEVRGTSSRSGMLHFAVGVMPAKQRILLQIPLKLSEMSESDLLDVPGIGIELARNIISYRQNNGGKMSLIDLPNVAGIGISKYAKLKKYFN